MSPYNSLYTRLAGGLIVLLFVIGVLYTALSTLAIQKFAAQLDQDLHRTLAANLVADKNLVEQGKLNEEALKKTFMQYMVVNPSIEIYLLDLEGKIVSYSAEPRAVMRSHVSLEPVQAFLSGAEKYPLGDDPRSHDKRKAFSVTEVPSGDAPEGYLYVVLRGEQYEAFETMAFKGFWARAGLWSMALSLILGLLAGLAIFYWLTKRLRRVSQRIEQFSESDFQSWSESQASQDGSDEIAQIEQVFEQMAGRIQSQLSALTEKDRQRRQLVAQVSHDLRTPLASMLGYLESLKLKGEGLSATQRVDFLDTAYRQGQRLSDLVDDLFQLSSLEAREIEPQLEPLLALELLHDVHQKYRMRLEKAGLTMRIEQDMPPAFAIGDVSLFERVLDNLIDNAIVHAEAGSEIGLRLRQDDRMLCIRVSNVGESIDAADLESVFDPFYRGGMSSADRKHAGLGLAIAKRIMESMHGRIEVENTGHGVAFTVCLPVADEKKGKLL